MGVKNTLKRWLKTVDEALLTEGKAPHSTPDGALPSEPSSDRQAHRIALSPLHAIVSPGNTIITPVDFHTDVDSIIAPKYVQVNSPHRIEPSLLEPFERGLKEVTLIFVQNQHVIPATIEAIHDTSLVVRTQHSTYFRKRGEVVLMLIPAQSQKSYVLQLTIEEIYAHRLMLRYQDPRYDVRRQVQLAAPVLLRLPSPVLLTAIRQRQARLMRQCTLPQPNVQRTTPAELSDQLYEPDATTPSSFMKRIEQTPPLTCDLLDISLGGACLSMPEHPQSEALLHRVLLVHMSLPLAMIESIEREYFPLNLHMLSVIRDTRLTTQTPTLHVRFLKRLPDELAPYFADLERLFLEQQRPLR